MPLLRKHDPNQSRLVEGDRSWGLPGRSRSSVELHEEGVEVHTCEYQRYRVSQVLLTALATTSLWEFRVVSRKSLDSPAPGVPSPRQPSALADPGSGQTWTDPG